MRDVRIHIFLAFAALTLLGAANVTVRALCVRSTGK
jgi:hypothetical protein